MTFNGCVGFDVAGDCCAAVIEPALSCRRCSLGFDERGEALQGIPSLQQTGDLCEFVAAEDTFDERRQEVQRLAAEKIHGAHRFEKERGRGRHAARDDRVGDSLEQCQIVRREGRLLGTQGKGMAEAGSKIVGATGEQSG